MIQDIHFNSIALPDLEGIGNRREQTDQLLLRLFTPLWSLSQHFTA